jgi:hypothetical protein
MPPPTDQLVAAQTSIRVADELGGNSDPQAALYLKLARDQLEKAKALMDDDENKAALRFLQRAEADAELALSLAKKRKTLAEAEQAIKELERLKASTSK